MQSAYTLTETATGQQTTFKDIKQLDEWVSSRCSLREVEKRVRNDLVRDITNMLKKYEPSVSDEYLTAQRNLVHDFEVGFKDVWTDTVSNEMKPLFEHQLYHHYLFCAWMNNCKSKSSSPIEKEVYGDLVSKKFVYTPSNKKYCTILPNFHEIARALYYVYGKVLPELTFYILTYIAMPSYDTEDFPTTDFKVFEEIWVKEFINTFYKPSEGSVVKRTDFIETFKEHIRHIISYFALRPYAERVLEDITKNTCLMTSPEKCSGLKSVRRSGGMYIRDIEKIEKPFIVKNSYPLLNSIRANEPNIIEKYGENLGLYDLNVSFEDNTNTLWWACQTNNIELVKRLVMFPVEKDIPNVEGETPVMVTIEPEIIKLLLPFNVDLNRKNKNYKNVLGRMAREKNKEMIELLIKHGADVKMAIEYLSDYTFLTWILNEDEYKKFRLKDNEAIELLKTYIK